MESFMPSPDGENKYFLAFVEETHGDISFKSYFRIVIDAAMQIEKVLDAMARTWYNEGEAGDGGYYHGARGSIFVKPGDALEISNQYYQYANKMFEERQAPIKP